MADHPAPLEVLAGVEAGRVDEGDDRQVERVAEADEASALLRRRDVERAGDRERLVGDDADGLPSDRREAGDEVRRPSSAQLEQIAVVDDRPDHVAHVVAAGRRVAGAGRRPPEWAGRADRPSANAAVPRRCARGGTRAAARSSPARRRRRRRRATRRRCAGRARARRRARSVDVHAGELGDHVGPLTNAYASAVMTTWSARPSRSAGPDTAGPVTASTTGTMPEHSASARAASAPAVEGGHAFDDVGAARRDEADERDPLCERVCAAIAMDSPSSELSAPLRTVGSIATTTAGRPPMSSTRAVTQPRVPARSATRTT